jgi:hypothetical protein
VTGDRHGEETAPGNVELDRNVEDLESKSTNVTDSCRSTSGFRTRRSPSPWLQQITQFGVLASPLP